MVLTHSHDSAKELWRRRLKSVGRETPLRHCRPTVRVCDVMHHILPLLSPETGTIPSHWLGSWRWERACRLDACVGLCSHVVDQVDHWLRAFRRHVTWRLIGSFNARWRLLYDGRFAYVVYVTVCNTYNTVSLHFSSVMFSRTASSRPRPEPPNFVFEGS